MSAAIHSACEAYLLARSALGRILQGELGPVAEQGAAPARAVIVDALALWQRGELADGLRCILQARELLEGALALGAGLTPEEVYRLCYANTLLLVALADIGYLPAMQEWRTKRAWALKVRPGLEQVRA